MRKRMVVVSEDEHAYIRCAAEKAREALGLMATHLEHKSSCPCARRYVTLRNLFGPPKCTCGHHDFMEMEQQAERMLRILERMEGTAIPEDLMEYREQLMQQFLQEIRDE